MIVHTDFDSCSDVTKEFKFPDIIEKIVVSNDSGHITITINDDKVFDAFAGTRDCDIVLNNEV